MGGEIPFLTLLSQHIADFGTVVHTLAQSIVTLGQAAQPFASTITTVKEEGLGSLTAVY
jgi:hypothetical protein